METSPFIYNEDRYIPTDISANELIMGAMADIYRAGKIVRDF